MKLWRSSNGVLVCSYDIIFDKPSLPIMLFIISACCANVSSSTVSTADSATDSSSASLDSSTDSSSASLVSSSSASIVSSTSPSGTSTDCAIGLVCAATCALFSPFPPANSFAACDSTRFNSSTGDSSVGSSTDSIFSGDSLTWFSISPTTSSNAGDG